MLQLVPNHLRSPLKLALLGLAFLTALPYARSQQLLTHRELSSEAALSIARGALDKCHADGYHVSLTVLDSSGLVKVQVRGDGAGLHTFDFSRQKAYTALTFRRTSAETAKAWAASTTPRPHIEGTVGAAGGVPIKAGDEVIGAVGVSGAPGGEKDEACAQAGIATIADALK